MSAEFSATLLFGLLALFLILVGKRRGFFEFHPTAWLVPLRLIHVLGAFAIYFLASLFFTKLLMSLWKKQIALHHISYASWLNFSLSFLVLLGLLLYMVFLPKPLVQGIWKRGKSSWMDDAWMAAYAWIMAFPLVLFLSQFLEWTVIKIFHLTQLPEQIAVKFLKSTFQHPLYFFLSVISIVVLAPLIEEILFRGFLQTYVRRHLGVRQAIVITSACFALFHYAAGQGLGNIAIILSLFVLALFLGFVYEKQGSLFASISLHALFNAVSVINLYLFG